MRNKLLTAVEPHVDVPAIGGVAPSSAPWRAIALLAPTICIAIYLLAALGFKGKLERTDLAFCLLVFVVAFPWSSRFKGSPLGGMYAIGSAWLVALSGLALLAHQTRSLNAFHLSALAVFAVVAPLLQCWSLGTVRGARFERNPAVRRSRKAVMVGAGALAMTVARALQARPVNPMELVGWFDDRSVDRLHAETSAKLLGPLSDLAGYVREHRIDEVYITLPMSSHPRIATLLEGVHGTTASVYYVPDIPGIGIIQGRLHHINGVPVLGLCETPFVGLNEVVKRASDILLSSLILIVTSPLMLAISIGVKLSSPGPVFFKQRRNGLDGREITVYKFRTMTVQEDGPWIVQATRNDPRVTPFGAFLRRTSLDELPQFFNVLEGQMSIVGPRPHAIAHNEHYRLAIKAYMVRHKVRPGITGWAQVNGMRGETESVERMQARIEYDLAYLRNWSLWLDLRIVAITIRLMFFDRNAY
jgi:putative colanic acid biosysnthesis UDP-glucose lipid carrier transferase